MQQVMLTLHNIALCELNNRYIMATITGF